MSLSTDEVRVLAERWYRNPVAFCREALTEWFPTEMPWVHWGILAILTRKTEFLLECPRLDKVLSNFVAEDVSGRRWPMFVRDKAGKIGLRMRQNVLVMLPRGFSKTTLTNAVSIYNIVFQEHPVSLFVSEAAAHAGRQMSNVTGQLLGNPALVAVFGEMRPEQRAGRKWSESDGEINTLTGMAVFARGRGGQVRGLNSDGRRPSWVVVDDVEDKESVATEEQRLKTREWFYGDLLPCLPALDKSATITVLGTLRNAGALLAYLARDLTWTTVKFGALDLEGEWLWPENMDVERHDATKETYAMQGLLHIFYLEYHNSVRASEAQKFRQEYIVYKQVADLDEVPFRAVAIDPAISEKPSACDCAFAAVGMRTNGQLVVLDVTGARGMSPREQVNEFFRMCEVWRPFPGCAGVEAIAYQAALVYLLKEEMARRGVFFEISKLTHSKSKEERILGILQPRYASGFVEHRMPFPKLETQLLDWPAGGMDYPDVVAMAASLLLPFAQTAAKDGYENLAKNSYEPLPNNWRRY